MTSSGAEGAGGVSGDGQEAGASPAADEKADTAAVVAANAEFYAAVEAADLDRVDAAWVEPPFAESVTCVHPGWPALRGRDEVLRSWALIMANTAYIQYFLTDVEVEVAGEVAVLNCTENILTSVGQADDATSSALGGGRVVATNVFRRVGDGWRLWAHHSSPVLAGDDGEAAE